MQDGILFLHFPHAARSRQQKYGHKITTFFYQIKTFTTAITTFRFSALHFRMDSALYALFMQRKGV